MSGTRALPGLLASHRRRSASSPDMHHGPRRRNEIWLTDVVAFFFFLDHAADEFGQLFVACSAAHLGVEIVVPYRKQAGADLAVAGDADAAAMSAERMRDGGDDSDFADAIVEAVAAGGLRARVRNLDQRAVLGHARQNFVERDYRVRATMCGLLRAA